MDKYAIIENGIIQNVIIADEDFIANNYPNAIIAPDFVGVGDKYENEKFTKVEIIDSSELN